jgi:hypothetical protein
MAIGDAAERMEAARQALEEALVALRRGDITVETFGGAAALEESLRLALDGMSGECTVEEPAAPLRGVLREDGGRIVYCCSHPTQHCSS